MSDGTFDLTGGNIVGKTLFDGDGAQPGVIDADRHLCGR